MEKKPQARNEQDGRYTFDGDLGRLCVCGHSLGVHAASAPHECFLYSYSEGSEERRAEVPLNGCRCQKFRPSRKARKP